uniref:CSON004154 protein n=1 Tax=Culicoides sonorensis TaxID=179676 RepID=A0A336MN41_CULSO
MFPKGVRTPLALLTALRLREPVPGKPWANEFTTFATPIAINSCDASTAAGSPAILEYASACGITVKPTVMPATRSPRKSSEFFRPFNVCL